MEIATGEIEFRCVRRACRERTSRNQSLTAPVARRCILQQQSWGMQPWSERGKTSG